MKKPLISLIMPVYNEEEIIEESIKDLISKLNKAFPKNYEVIIVENGSKDKTLQILNKLKKRFKIKVLTYKKGADYGRAMCLGFLKSKGKYFINCSADWHDIEFIKSSMPYLKHFDCVLSSKFMNKKIDTRGIIRKTVSWGYNSLLFILFQPKNKDTHAINIYNSKKVKPIAKLCKTGKSLFPTELVLRCEKKNLKIKTVPIKIKEKRSARKSIVVRTLKTFMGVFKLKYTLQKDKTF